jgi:hypothetical protein
MAEKNEIWKRRKGVKERSKKIRSVKSTTND